jgi:hypothetical protein
MLVKPVYDAARADSVGEMGEQRPMGIARFPMRSKRRTRCRRMLQCSVIWSWLMYA